MAKKRLTRKQLLKEPDEFITLTGRVINWSRQNVKALAVCGIALLVMVLGLSGFLYYNQKREMTAAALYGQGVVKIQEQGSAEDQGPALLAAEPDIQNLVAHYGGQASGRLGRILLGHIHLAKKEPEKAIELYQKALDDYRDDPSLANVIYNGLCAALELKGERAAAIAHAEKIVAASSPVLKDVALFRLGRLHQQAGDHEKSVKAYEQLSTDFPESVYATISKERVSS